MDIIVRRYVEDDVKDMIKIWNEVVEDGIAFPQEESFSYTDGKIFFENQTYCAVAENIEDGEVLGMYILHPNNVGRCGHICNASYKYLITVIFYYQISLKPLQTLGVLLACFLSCKLCS